MSELKVGGTIYRRNGNPVEIIGETKVSWIIGDRSWEQQKIKKSAMRKGNSGEHWVQFFVNQQDALDCAYAGEHRHRIGSLVGVCDDAKVIRQIAALIDYVPEVKR